jgi:uncharacterized pyridoxamine 5'-phosphate oxidase family protein
MNPKGTPEELAVALEFARRERVVVLATVSPEQAAEAALMGVVVTAEFEVFFDTKKTTRKYGNLLANPRAALVIGCTNGVSIQYEGIGHEVESEELKRYLPEYFEAFPNGKERQETWPEITYFVIRPKWMR